MRGTVVTADAAAREATRQADNGTTGMRRAMARAHASARVVGSDDGTCTVAPAGLSADLYTYVRRTAYRVASGVPGLTADDVSQDIVVNLLARGADMSADTSAARQAVMWEGRTLRSRGVERAQMTGDLPSAPDSAGGIVGTGTTDVVVHYADVDALAWAALARRDVAAYRLAVWATYCPIGRGGMPATGTLLPHADTTDRDTRGQRVRDALHMWAACRDDIVSRAHDAGRIVSDPSGRTAYRRVASVLIDGGATIRRYGWQGDADRVEMIRAVTGALSGADMRGIMRTDVKGVAGTVSAPRGPRANTGAKGRSGAMSGAPGAGVRAGGGVGVYRDRERLAGESAAPMPTVTRDHGPLHDGFIGGPTDVPVGRPDGGQREYVVRDAIRDALAAWRREADAYGRLADARAAGRAARTAGRAPAGRATPDERAAVIAYRAAREAALAADVARDAAIGA